MTAGSVIVLNGPSSVGKSTLARALQQQFAAAGECWFILALDDFIGKLPADWVAVGDHRGSHARDGLVFEVVDGEFELRTGPIGRRMLAAWRGTVAAVAHAGLDVIVDEVVLSEVDWQGWQTELAGLDAHWVRVHARLDQLEERERSRPDFRVLGQARAQHDAVHRHPTYDAQVDTGALNPDVAASAVITGWRAREP